jgi:hypothetical protein
MSEVHILSLTDIDFPDNAPTFFNGVLLGVASVGLCYRGSPLTDPKLSPPGR